MTLFKAVGATGGTPKSMVAYIGTAHYYMSFESPVGTDYVVPQGKTFKITKLVTGAFVAGVVLGLGYGSEGVPSQAAAPAGEVLLTAYTTWGAIGASPDVYFEVPAGKYPFYRCAAAHMVILFGIEE